jgi:hypothetical protein
MTPSSPRVSATRPANHTANPPPWPPTAYFPPPPSSLMPYVWELENFVILSVICLPHPSPALIAQLLCLPGPISSPPPHLVLQAIERIHDPAPPRRAHIVPLNPLIDRVAEQEAIRLEDEHALPRQTLTTQTPHTLVLTLDSGTNDTRHPMRVGTRHDQGDARAGTL